MSTVVVWLHGDSLSPHDPALAANPSAPALFVFDERFLANAGLSFKRLMFLYECALDAFAGRVGEIRRGDVVAELVDFCRAHHTREIHVTASVAPRFRRYLSELRAQGMQVVVHQQQPLVDWRGESPRRFSAFWRNVEADALRQTGSGPADVDA